MVELFKEKEIIKEKYTTFYYAMLDYVAKASSEKRWYFMECYDVESNGNHFSVIYQSFETDNKWLCIDATKNGNSYILTSKIIDDPK